MGAGALCFGFIWVGVQMVRSPAQANLGPVAMVSDTASDALREPFLAGVSGDGPASSQPAAPTAQADCDSAVTATPRAGSLVMLTISAPCHADAAVRIRHNAMVFDTTLSDAGGWSGLVPALSATATFGVVLADETLTATTAVADFHSHSRIVLQSRGNADLTVHAREYGAGTGDAGHVWRGAPGLMPGASGSDGGFLLRLGNGEDAAARIAEIYTFPAGHSTRRGAIRLSIEAAITERTCGRDLNAEILQPGLGGDLAATQITIETPDCGGTDGILVLKNILRDMKIAANQY